MSALEIVLVIAGLALISLLTRSFFLLPDRELPLPDWVGRALRYAPLAALVAIVVPDVLLTQGRLLQTVADARLLGAVAAASYYFWRRGILGTIVVGMLVFMPLRIGLGW
ncbi:branched-subunit amino acid transport protein [Sphaerotilus hippei]|uniref:Branched-subunit amino acid transport protein n=1 Tax=Sphaerotilus hippei TaxID=744406 RepID=A0A318H2W8_9BURK|nr:AzlD domain-containing protein [Sphaerotilus hippei]PXW95896.1 branched-subunit amino acid transport protein [Sphaerotilus hippei]